MVWNGDAIELDEVAMVWDGLVMMWDGDAMMFYAFAMMRDEVAMMIDAIAIVFGAFAMMRDEVAMMVDKVAMYGRSETCFILTSKCPSEHREEQGKCNIAYHSFLHKGLLQQS